MYDLDSSLYDYLHDISIIIVKQDDQYLCLLLEAQTRRVRRLLDAVAKRRDTDATS